MGKHIELKHNVQEIKNASSDTASDKITAVESVGAQVNNDGDSNVDQAEEIYDNSDEDEVVESPLVDGETKYDVGDMDEDDEDAITPLGLSKRKRAIIDEEDEEVPKEKKSNSPGKEGPSVEHKASQEASVSDDVSTCSYCSAKIPKDYLPAHMSKEHAWLDAEIDDKVTYAGSELDDVDYDDVEVDYDEEGDDFFEDGNLEERPGTANSLDTEDCDFCEEKIERSSMNQHLSKQHDINMTEDTQPPSSDKSNSTDMSVTPCPVCSKPIATAILALHITYYHAAEVGKQDVVTTEIVAKDEAVSDVGDQCEMCDERMPTNKMVAHLLEAHDIKVIDDKLDESSEVENYGTVGGEDPFDMPDFLREKPKPKIKCHHCQKKFSTREKLDVHVNKRHEKKCQVCVTYKLVQENRYIGIMKQLNKTAKGLKEDALPPSDNNVTGQVEDIVYNYEDLYPEKDFEECEECEDDFYWRIKDHACDLTMANVRILCGIKFNWGDPDEDENENVDGEG